MPFYEKRSEINTNLFLKNVINCIGLVNFSATTKIAFKDL